MYKFRNFLLLIFLNLSCDLYSQNPNCINVSNRIKYSFPLNGSVFLKPVSSQTGFLTGEYSDNNDTAAILAKIDLDNVIWAKQYHSGSRFYIRNPFLLQDGSVIINSASYQQAGFLLAKFNPAGNVTWATKLGIRSSHNYRVFSDNQTSNSITVYNNAIFLTAIYQEGETDTVYNVIAKLDLDGNILWSTALVSNQPRPVFLNDPPSIVNDTVMVTSNVLYTNNMGFNDSMAVVITKLNATDGKVVSNQRLTTQDDGLLKGLRVINSKMYVDNSITLTGVIGVQLPLLSAGLDNNTGIPFVLSLSLSPNDNLSRGVYHIYPHQSGYGLDVQDFNTCFTNNKETGLLFTDGYNGVGYSVIIDSSLSISSSRVFHPHSSNYFLERSYYADDNNTIYYSFPYNPNNHQTDLEYARISPTANANSLDCFGRDTSVLQPHSFSILKDSFSWDNEYHDLLIAKNFTVTEAPFTINQETICSQVSICDTIKIKGNNNHCLPDAATFTLYKNSACLKKVKWILDSTSTRITNQANDTTIDVKFLQPFHGYIRAEFEGCTLKDSFYIDVNTPMKSLSLGNDTLLCPNKNIALNAGSGFKTYKWQDNSSDSSFIVTQPGIYFVETTDSCGNIFNDSVIIKPLDVSFDLLYSNSKCSYDTATVALDPKLKNYSWTPPDEAIRLNNTLNLFPSSTTLFTISGDRLTGCRLSDTLLIKVIDCPEYFYIPNAFTPNNDGRNDTFKPTLAGKIDYYNFSIYNRYGQKVFNSIEYNKGWDGKVNGAPQDAGIFVWTCTYKFLNRIAMSKKGAILLVK